MTTSKKKTHGQIYGRPHRRWASILPNPAGMPCPRCKRPMYKEQKLHLGHTEDVALGGADSPRRWEHAGCNLRAGGALGAARRKARRYTSRDICDNPQIYAPGYMSDIHTEDW